MLLWHLCHEALPVGSVLSQKIENLIPTCARCLDKIENHLHLFRDCHYSKMFWSHVFHTFGAPSNQFLPSFYTSNWKDWVCLNLSQNLHWTTVFGTTIWHIWKIRNEALFRGCSKHHSSNFASFMYDVGMNLQTFQGKGKQIDTLAVHATWKAPPQGCIKINTDGSYKDQRTASGGGVYRNDKGEWLMGFTIKFRVRKPVEAELLAMRYGLELAKKAKFENLQLEVDAKAIMMMLNNVEAHISHELGAILHEVASLIKEMKVEILYSPRSSNVLAHVLGREGWCSTQDITIHEIVPDFTRKAYQSDHEGGQGTREPSVEIVET